jgi:hypothetical protein
MKYSIHTYTVNMGVSTDNVVWNIYDSTATRERIDANIDLPYSKTTAYHVISQTQVGGVASFEIEFSGNLVVWRKYTIAYREQGNDLCYIYQFLDFVLQEPFDVDILPVADQCPGSHLQYLEGAGIPATQTTVEYHVVLQNDDYDPPGNWYFTYQITATGISGTSATIERVEIPDISFVFNQPPLISTYTNNAVIPIAIRDVQFLVTYNDVPGVRQRINFNLTLIEGAYSERDIDVINGTPGNDAEHYIESIPGPGFILAMD